MGKKSETLKLWVEKQYSLGHYVEKVAGIGFSTLTDAARNWNIPPEGLRRVEITITVKNLPDTPGITDERMKRAQTSWDAPGDYCTECTWRTEHGWCPLIEGFPGGDGCCSEFRKESKDDTT